MTDRIEAIIFDWKETLYDKSKEQVFPWSERVLEYLSQKRYKMGLISLANGGGDKAGIVKDRQLELDESGLVRYFDCVMVVDAKNQNQFLECMSRLGAKPENTLVVDDRTIRGIKAGNSLGCPTAWVQRGQYSGEVPNSETGEPTYRINSVEDLLTIL